MDLSIIGYLLFIIPGFCLVWTFRHFTKSKNGIGEFEYAGWSFLWGIALFFLDIWIMKITRTPLPQTSTNDPIRVAGAFLGMGLAIAIGLSFPLGYFGAVISKWGLFKWIDKKLFRLIEKIIIN